MKSFIGATVSNNGDKHGLANLFAVCTRQSANSVAKIQEGEYRIWEHADDLLPEIARATKWKFCDLEDEAIYTSRSEDTDVPYYSRNVSSGVLKEISHFPKNAYATIGGWLAIKPKKIRQKDSWQRVFESTFVHVDSGKTYTLKGCLEIQHQIDSSKVLLNIDGGIKGWGLDDTALACLDIKTGEYVWHNKGDNRFICALTSDLYWGVSDGVEGVCSMSDGSLVKACGLYGDEGKQDFRFNTLRNAINGILRAYDVLYSRFYEYNANTDTENVWLLSDENSRPTVSLVGDELIMRETKNKRLKIYSLAESKVILDKPFDSEKFLPRRCENSDDLVCRTGEPMQVYRTDAGYAFNINERGDMQLSDIPRVYLFDLDELDQDEIVVEREEFSCQYERIIRDDGDSEYRIWFDQPEPFQKLLRHADVMADNIFQNFGTSSYPDAKTDRQWMGLIRIDLSNQSLNEEQRWIFERLPVLVTKMHDFQFRAGTDWDDHITFQIEFADD